MASECEDYRCRVNAAEGRRQWRANMKAGAVGSIGRRPQVLANELLLGLGQVRLGYQSSEIAESQKSVVLCKYALCSPHFIA